MIVLASKSPRRKKILTELGYSFIVCPAHNDEIFDLSLGLDEALKKVAKQKALEVQDKYPSDLIVSADTIVCFKNLILGKPKDEQDAISTLKMLSNHKHQVKTGVCVLYKEKAIVHVETSDVYFKELSDTAILDYVHSGRCMDKAGSYGIQECDFVDHISGDYSNIVGLPKMRVDAMIKAFAQREYKC
jgi:septum formation protein